MDGEKPIVHREREWKVGLILRKNGPGHILSEIHVPMFKDSDWDMGLETKKRC